METGSICNMLMKEEIEAQQSGFSSPWGGLSWYRRKCDEKMEIEKRGKIRVTRKITSADPTTTSTTKNPNIRLY